MEEKSSQGAFPGHSDERGVGLTEFNTARDGENQAIYFL